MNKTMKVLVAMLAITALLTSCNSSSKKTPQNNPTVTVEQNDRNNDTNNNNGTDPTQIFGSIDANTTWPDLGLDVDYIIDGWIDINSNSLLTIEPGVTLMFTGVDACLYVGENAGLKMVGTADKPIRLVNPLNNNNPGAWRGIDIRSNRGDNQLEYVEFINGGADENPVVRNEGKLSMKHCLIDGGLGNGVELSYDGVFSAFENNTIKNVNCPLWINSHKKINSLGNGNSFTNNTNNMITIDEYWLDGGTITFKNQGIPYFIPGGMNVCENSKMIVDAGVEFVFDYEKELIVSEDSRMEVNGTESQPVVFRAKNDEDPWKGMEFRSNRSGNVINYAQIKNCGISDNGNERCCLYISSDAKLTLSNCVFGPSAYNGVGIENIENWSNVTHSGNTFTGCAKGNVFIQWGGQWNGKEYVEESTLDQLP